MSFKLILLVACIGNIGFAFWGLWLSYQLSKKLKAIRAAMNEAQTPEAGPDLDPAPPPIEQPFYGFRR